MVVKLKDHKYVHFTITKCEATTFQDIFRAHPESIKLFTSFPKVLILDSTYKTNLYKISFFEIVGVTSTNKTYYVAFAFLTSEKEENFTWVLQALLDLPKLKDDMPKVIVTDRGNALMNVVATIFPNTTTLLCYFHVGKMLELNASQTVGQS